MGIKEFFSHSDDSDGDKAEAEADRQTETGGADAMADRDTADAQHAGEVDALRRGIPDAGIIRTTPGGPSAGS